MKHLKHFKLFESNELQQEHPIFPETEDEIHSLCKKYEINNYTINDDLSIDVEGSVWLNNKELKYLPLNFNKVGGYFYCSDNNLKSLKGCPNVVDGSFNCGDNNLKSLKGCPNEVGGNFTCYSNNIRSLNYFPKNIEVYINIFNNPIYSLVKKFIKKNNKNELAKEFEFYGIISRDETTVYWDRYTEFCEDYDIELGDINEIRNDYKVID